MSHMIRFSKAKAQQMIEALNEGKPIEPPSAAGWTGFDMIALAGACFFVCGSQGPQLHSGQDFDTSKLGDEQREATDQTLLNELHASFDWHAARVREVVDGLYDEKFEPDHKVVIASPEYGEVKVLYRHGFKPDAE